MFRYVSVGIPTLDIHPSAIKQVLDDYRQYKGVFRIFRSNSDAQKSIQLFYNTLSSKERFLSSVEKDRLICLLIHIKQGVHPKSSISKAIAKLLVDCDSFITLKELIPHFKMKYYCKWNKKTADKIAIAVRSLKERSPMHLKLHQSLDVLFKFPEDAIQLASHMNSLSLRSCEAFCGAILAEKRIDEDFMNITMKKYTDEAISIEESKEERVALKI